MARNNENTRHSKYVIRIVCEGEKTEPLFFTSLCDLYFKDCEDMDVRTIPQPNIPQDEEAENSSRGNYKGKKRKTKVHEENPVEDVVITGTPPLKWVQYARQILSEGVDESWAVYDKDEHPKHEEALTMHDAESFNYAYTYSAAAVRAGVSPVFRLNRNPSNFAASLFNGSLNIENTTTFSP